MGEETSEEFFESTLGLGPDWHVSGVAKFDRRDVESIGLWVVHTAQMKAKNDFTHRFPVRVCFSVP